MVEKLESPSVPEQRTEGADTAPHDAERWDETPEDLLQGVAKQVRTEVEDPDDGKPKTIAEVYGGNIDPTTGKRKPGRPKGAKTKLKLRADPRDRNAPIEAHENARGWRRYSKRVYDSLLAAFRLHPGNYSRASKLAGVSVEMARTAWTKGWTDKPGFAWATPIEKVIEEELGLGRAKKAEHLAMELAQKDAEAERKRTEAMAVTQAEMALMAASRGGLQAVHDNIGGLLKTCKALVAAINAKVAEDIIDPVTRTLKPASEIKMKPAEMMGLIRKVTEMQRDAVTVSARLVELNDPKRGQATIIHEHRVGDISPEEAEREIAEMDAIYAQVIRNRALADAQPSDEVPQLEAVNEPDDDD